jgi:cell division protein FtsW
MVVLFAAGARIGHFILLLAVAMPVLWQRIEDVQYQLLRMAAFLDPGADRLGATYQVDQSLIGLGAGRLFGVGFGQGQQKLGFLPYPYNDFIFSTIGEEWGFVGVVFLTLAYATFVLVGLRLARAAGDPFRQYLAVGLVALIGIDAFTHMGVGLGILPTTGLVLPFVSYGRSGLVIALAATGLLINIGSRRRTAVP